MGKPNKKYHIFVPTVFCIPSGFLPCCKNKNESIQIVLLLLSLLLLLEQVVTAPIPAVKNHYTYSLYWQENWFKNCIMCFFLHLYLLQFFSFHLSLYCIMCLSHLPGAFSALVLILELFLNSYCCFCCVWSCLLYLFKKNKESFPGAVVHSTVLLVSVSVHS